MYSKSIKTVPVGTLNVNDAFVKVLNGLPCATPMNYVTTYDGTTEAETFDGIIKTMSKFQLVYKLQ
ncbi:hypothetical protein [Tenacibaculum ovolyticum]|uniref:hypothetical protein n=1 Tax=Tenacibaculum ovolyticum TaxID=104270 RepID=UPI003BAB991A